MNFYKRYNMFENSSSNALIAEFPLERKEENMLKNLCSLDPMPSIITDKRQAVRTYVAYMFARAHPMLAYDGLPETIPERNLKLLLQTNGYTVVVDPKFTDGKMYVFYAGLGGQPNPYYMPTIATISNPALNFSKNLIIGSECVLIPHDSMFQGLLPLCERYATLLAENDITMRTTGINSRIPAFISASDDEEKKSAEKYLQDIEDGKIGVVAENAFLEGIKTHPYANTASNITSLIEYQQYLKASFYNEIGLNANFNMKREALNSAESGMNDDILSPFVDDILTTQQKAFDEVNRLYGTKIKVSLSSAWKERREKGVTTNNTEKN